MRQMLVYFLILIFGLAYIFITPSEPVLFNILIKIIPMFLIIYLAIQVKSPFSRSYKKYITIGLTVSMIADAVIYWFLAGLGTFFLAHIFYIIAFQHVNKRKMPILVGAIFIIYSIAIGVLLIGAQIPEKEYILAGAIFAYIAVIFLMGWKSIGTKLPLAMIGAILFILSDSVLAFDRFIEAVPYVDALVMIPYYSAQFFIAKSVGSRFVKYSVVSKNLIR